MSSTATTETTKTTTPYDLLLEELDMVQQLSRASSVLEYDKMVFMPHTASASTERGKQSAALATIIHEKSTSTKLGELLEKADTSDSTTPEQVRNIELAKRDYRKKTCIPTELAAKKASLSSESYMTWTKAREEDDFSKFSNVLNQCIDTAKEIATFQREDESKSLYAVMLDEYEVGMNPDRIDSIFLEVKQALVPLIEKVLGPDARPPPTNPLKGTFPVDAQKQVCNKIVRDIGFQDANGRIDVSVHPFTMSLNPSDVRITSRFREDEWYQGLAGTVHEGGHAIYEQNIGTKGLPVDAALSMGMHESQSLFWERHVGLSKPFWEYAAPIINESFGTSHSHEELYGAVNAASRSFIRVEADELTYPLHVILRYEIERDFVEGKLSTDDIPERWNADFEKLLGLKVPSDAKGCLQDVHWSMIAYGYFPTYLIGAATAAQLSHYCRQDIPDLDDKIRAGEFSEIKAWLTDKIHRHGRHYKSLDEHLKAQLGEPLSPKYYIKYLTDKYTDLYKC